MSNVMAALPNIGGALCWTPQSLADAHYSSACRAVTLQILGERKTWTESEFYTWQNSVRGKNPRKCIYSVPAQEAVKYRAKFDWPPLSDVGAVTKPRPETH